MRGLAKAVMLTAAVMLASAACSPPAARTGAQESTAANPGDGTKDKASKEERKAEKLKKKAAKQALKASRRL